MSVTPDHLLHHLEKHIIVPKQTGKDTLLSIGIPEMGDFGVCSWYSMFTLSLFHFNLSFLFFFSPSSFLHFCLSSIPQPLLSFYPFLHLSFSPSVFPPSLLLLHPPCPPPSHGVHAGTFRCPRCNATTCEQGRDCPNCGIFLISSQDLARARASICMAAEIEFKTLDEVKEEGKGIDDSLKFYFNFSGISLVVLFFIKSNSTKYHFDNNRLKIIINILFLSFFPHVFSVMHIYRYKYMPMLWRKVSSKLKTNESGAVQGLSCVFMQLLYSAYNVESEVLSIVR